MSPIKVILKKQITSRVAAGHPWVYANEVSAIQGDPDPGGTVEVFRAGGQFVGRGFINSKSQILVRILTRDRSQPLDKEFLEKRILAAWAYRQKLGLTENCRLIFGEADGLPGLIVDKFNDCFVLQAIALGMDLRKEEVCSILRKLFSPRGIYERNDVPVRQLEGLPQVKGFLGEPFETRIVILEHGLRFIVDLDQGQKTGYFLDQHRNRAYLEHISSGAEVLDAFCYTGSFSCHAARYGATSVLGLDISDQATALAGENATLNGLQDRCRFQTANVFDLLKTWGKEGRKFDMVILDPPAFAKSRENIARAVTGYKEINLRAMKLLRPGGFLVTASCTGLVTPELFLQTVSQAAQDARKHLRQVVFSQQAPDHPIVWGIENSAYLKFLIVEVS